MKLTTEDVALIVTALRRSISRFEAEARYATEGRGRGNFESINDKAKKMRAVRDRILSASSVELED